MASWKFVPYFKGNSLCPIFKDGLFFFLFFYGVRFKKEETGFFFD